MLNGAVLPHEVGLALAACHRLARERARAVRKGQAHPENVNWGGDRLSY